MYAVHACRQMPRVKQGTVADHIYEQFIRVKAPMEINVSEDSRKEIAAASTKEVKVRRGGREQTESVTARTAATFDSLLLAVERLIRQNEKNLFLRWLNDTRQSSSSISQLAMNASVSTDCQGEIRKLAALGAPLQ